MKFFDMREVINEYPQATLYMAVGRRGCGKTWSVKAEIIENFIDNNKGFVYVARQKEDLKSDVLSSFFDDISSVYQKSINRKFNIKNGSIHYYSGSFWIIDQDDAGGKKYITEIGIVTSVKDAQRFKRRVIHTWINRIIFDEVITDAGYFRGDREVDYFQRIVETVAREGNDDVKIYLLGNPDYNIEQCPYFYQYNLNYEKMDINDLITFDTEDLMTHELIKNNAIFIKVGKNSETFLNTKTGGLFSITESRMAYDGTVKHSSYNLIDIKSFQEDFDFKPVFTLEQETAVLIGSYPKKIYLTVGLSNNIPTAVIHSHDRYKKSLHLIGVYDKSKAVATQCIYRANLRTFPKGAALYNKAVGALNVFVESEGIAQTFYNIMGEGKNLPYILQ